MIKPGELQKKAHALGVRDQQIEKDYILSWILFGIAHHKHLATTIAFKGGTVLKIIYFEGYRFSEDLDFTLLNNEISNDLIFSWFREIFQFIKDEANIPLEIIDLSEQEDTRPPDGQGGITFYIRYVGPLGGQGDHKKVKVDISRSEKLEFTPVTKDAIISYSDMKEYQLLCYPLEEVLVEKLRSVMQRMQARDFYDIWYLLEEHRMDIGSYLGEFEAKCKSKQLTHTDFPKKLNERLPQYKARWKGSLSEQIKDLPEFERVEREVLRHIKRVKF